MYKGKWNILREGNGIRKITERNFMKRANNLYGQILKEPLRSIGKSLGFVQKHELQQLKGITGIKTKNNVR